jgi:hypothetical protein
MEISNLFPRLSISSWNKYYKRVENWHMESQQPILETVCEISLKKWYFEGMCSVSCVILYFIYLGK